jgi:hypothetical protein
VNTILHEFPNVKEIFQAIGDKQREFNWLITDFEGFFDGTDAFSEDRVWISGDDLTQLINAKNIFFIWAVFSAFEKDVKIDPESLTVEPDIIMNDNLFGDNPKIRHPLATAEINLWDSSKVLFLSKDFNLSQRFRSYFINWEDLNKYNAKHNYSGS